jgi:hypothetical protein
MYDYGRGDGDAVSLVIFFEALIPNMDINHVVSFLALALTRAVRRDADLIRPSSRGVDGHRRSARVALAGVLGLRGLAELCGAFSG